jgi:hypothetical protein
VGGHEGGDQLIYDGRSWSSPGTIDAGNGLGSVSCPRARFCAAVDEYGYALTYDGSSWSAPTPQASEATLKLSATGRPTGMNRPRTCRSRSPHSIRS